MEIGLRSLGRTGNSLLAGVAIAASTGALVIVLYYIASALKHPEPHVTFAGNIAPAVWNGIMGAIFGAILGSALAFAALVTILRHLNPWAAFVPLVVGASCGLGLAMFIDMQFLPLMDGYRAYLALISGAAAGGFATSFIIRPRRR